MDERINFVATKAVHLGDQLEGVNTPRTRAAEALMLIKYFSEFMSNEQPTSELFTDPNQVCNILLFGYVVCNINYNILRTETFS